MRKNTITKYIRHPTCLFRTHGKGIRKRDPEVNIWVQKRRKWGVGRLYNEELHSLHRYPNIVKVNKCRRLRWAGHLARMEIIGVLSKF